MNWHDCFAALRARAARVGFDLAAAGCAGWYDRQVPAAYRLPDVGGPGRLVVVLGNTRALWPHFSAAMTAHPAKKRRDDPLDHWVEETLEPIFRASIPVRWEARYAHQPPPLRVGFQRLADAVGLAHMGPSLVVHPTYGPWIALRAAVVIDLAGPAAPAPLPAPCERCEGRPCVPAMEAALASGSHDLMAFLPVREACPVGREHRYGPNQLRYHYRRDRDALAPDLIHASPG